ncbi:3-oxoacyl-ACP reductase FabG [Streptomyces sp. ZAF1911]|uniref:3-oxoacyl-ACP reductase FabG n=1 Tax=Streptomyces sp. ZAF1911 TaxID=2944129 RepID=UPI00237BE580|nr:3-oxoacyl-ACP reductase FabG [Streptomyces sp. ZAF1911]MDD9377566.1 3-oxoacyl-ACP reductase FabG [Streptomyces sp. ZAF1911]
MSRSVLVTGGNRGIGLATARAFAEQGDKVTVTYRTGEPPEGLFGVRCDVTDPESVRRAVEEARIQHGPIQVLVSNAGITRDELFVGMHAEDFRAVIETNLLAAVAVTKEVLPDMLKARWGRIVLVASVSAMSGAPGQTNYAASKAGLIGFGRSLSREVGRRKVTVNVVTPGLIETDMVKDVTGPRREHLLSQTSLFRAGEPEEVAGVVKFLASDEASYVTSAVVPVTGGLGVGH